MLIIRKFKTVHWTAHCRQKMRFYGLSEGRVRRVLHSPTRVEEGIAEHTAAVMQRVPSPKHPSEIWVMIEDRRDKRNVVSAWRYPGTTRPGKPLPPEILREIHDAG